MNKKIKSLDTLDIVAKKKKNFLIVGVIVIVVSILGISIGSALLNVDKKKLYKEKKAITDDKTLKVIQNPEYKETWAISIENRLEDQNKKLSEVIAELSFKQTKMLTEIKKELREGNQKKSDEIAELGSSMDQKFRLLSTKVQEQLDENDRKMEQVRIMADNVQEKMDSVDNEIIVGPDLLPRQPEDLMPRELKDTENKDVSDVTKDILKNSDINKETEENLEKEEPEEVISVELKKPNFDKVDTTSNYNLLDDEVIKSEKLATTSYDKPIPDEIIPAKKVNHKKNIRFVDIDTSFNDTIIANAIKMDKSSKQVDEDLLTNGFHISTGLTQVYMVTGAYAPAFSDSDSEPLPVLMETEGSILMSNDNFGSVDKCFLLGSAKGNMNSETADIRLVSISCLLDEGKYRIEGSISGWVIGENGIPGVPGELLHKNGAWIAKTFVSGFLETFSQALVTSAGPQINLGGYGNTGGGDSSQVGTGDAIGANAMSAGAGGVSTVFNKLGEYYLKMAEQIFPVIEVKGGRNVDVLLMGGEDLTIVENNKVDMSLMNEFIEQEKQKNSSKNANMSNNAFTQAISKGSNSDGMSAENGGSAEEGEEPSLDNSNLDEFNIN